jgi:hypothetical protein
MRHSEKAHPLQVDMQSQRVMVSIDYLGGIFIGAQCISNQREENW